MLGETNLLPIMCRLEQGITANRAASGSCCSSQGGYIDVRGGEREEIKAYAMLWEDHAKSVRVMHI